MLYKKINKLLATVLITLLVFIGFKLLHKPIQQIHNEPIVKQQIQTDTTQYKVKEILKTNKLQSLECKVTIIITDSRHIQAKYFQDIVKFFTSKKLVLTSDYKGLFSYDLSKAQFIQKGNVCEIILDTNDLELNVVQADDIKTNETISYIGNFYDSQETTDLITYMQEQAKEQLNTNDNKNEALRNVKYDLTELFTKAGLNLDRIIIISN